MRILQLFRTAAVLSFYCIILTHLTDAWEYPNRFSTNLSAGWVRTLQSVDKKPQGNTTKVTITPTSSPTESPAPSPSPSHQPTFAPTVTGEPTASPTSSPTESPAPSPSPSHFPTLSPTASVQPSFQPTTTRFPSESPSNRPSPAPSGSSMPSSSPSNRPSSSPSNAPSVSMAPSSNPSISPSSSSQPSTSPTYIGTQSAFFTAHLQLAKKLTAEQELAFATGTEEFVEQLDIDGGLTFPQVVLEFQSLVTSGFNMTFTSDGSSTTLAATSTYVTSGTTPSDRGLQQEVIPSEPVPVLELHFEVAAIYTGSDTEFDLFATLNPLFQQPNDLWIHMLGNYNDVFLPLRPPAPSAVEGNTNASERSISAGGLSAILLVALVAVGLAIAAAIFSVRSHTLLEYGEALESPRGSACDTLSNDFGVIPVNENYNAGFIETQTYPMEKVTETEIPHEDLSFGENHETDEERGRTSILSEHVFKDIAGLSQNIGAASLSGNHFSNVPLQRSHGSVDPPTESEVGVSEANYEQYGYRIDASSSRDKQAHLVHQVLGASPAATGTNGMDHVGQPNLSFYADDQELKLTRTMGGTLGAAPIDGASPSSSNGSATDSFFNNILSGKRKKKQKQGRSQVQANAGFLGARPLRYDSQVDLEDRVPYETRVGRGGLYDVFAPAGPIGIVVDTTKDGPCVHSLKPTSPMLGLINPGDLIVGLDDEDTRGMTAATLTRLMARKSNQKERKITLLAAGVY